MHSLVPLGGTRACLPSLDMKLADPSRFSEPLPLVIPLWKDCHMQIEKAFRHVYEHLTSRHGSIVARDDFVVIFWLAVLLKRV